MGTPEADGSSALAPQVGWILAQRTADGAIFCPPVSPFAARLPTLDAWLRGDAPPNEAGGGAHTHIADAGDRVAGLGRPAAGSAKRGRGSGWAGTGPTRSSIPGSSAVATARRGRRLTSDLLIDAAGRSLAAAGTVSARAVIVPAIDDRAPPAGGSAAVRPRSANRPCRSGGCPGAPACRAPTPRADRPEPRPWPDRQRGGTARGSSKHPRARDRRDPGAYAAR